METLTFGSHRYVIQTMLGFCLLLMID